MFSVAPSPTTELTFDSLFVPCSQRPATHSQGSGLSAGEHVTKGPTLAGSEGEHGAGVRGSGCLAWVVLQPAWWPSQVPPPQASCCHRKPVLTGLESWTMGQGPQAKSSTAPHPPPTVLQQRTQGAGRGDICSRLSSRVNQRLGYFQAQGLVNRTFQREAVSCVPFPRNGGLWQSPPESLASPTGQGSGGAQYENRKWPGP